MNDEIAGLFSAGLEKLNLSLDLASQHKLLQFLQLLVKWNRHYNLTAITDMQKMVTHHLLDSLSIAPYVIGENILDIGSGAGFPGIPLAVYFPQKQWTLLDSNGKKTRFLTQAKAELHLSNVTVMNVRMEQWRPLQKFDALVVRAVGSIKEIIEQTHHYLQPGGYWLFMKGDYQREDLESIQFPTKIHPLNVPQVFSQRYLIIIERPFPIV